MIDTFFFCGVRRRKCLCVSAANLHRVKPCNPCLNTFSFSFKIFSDTGRLQQHTDYTVYSFFVCCKNFVKQILPTPKPFGQNAQIFLKLSTFLVTCSSSRFSGMECRRNQGSLIPPALKNTVLIREIRVKYFSFSVLSFRFHHSVPPISSPSNLPTFLPSKI